MRGHGDRKGHSYVAALAYRDLPPGPLKDFFLGNTVWMQTNASLADRLMLRGDRTEPSRHHFFVEHYQSGKAKILPANARAALQNRTDDQLFADGTLPLTIRRHSDLLARAFREGRWDDAMGESLLLAGYASDACQPFRASGIGGDPDVPGSLPRRFESGVVRRAIGFRDLSSGTPLAVTDAYAASLAALREAAAFAPVLADADRASGGDSAANEEDGATYWPRFVPVARPIAAAQLNMAGRFLSGLWLSAWNNAGRPSLPRTFAVSDRILPYAPPLTGTPNLSAPMEYPALPDDTRDAARDRIHALKITSKLLGRDIDVTVVLPHGYDTTQNRYPVLYLLHGSSGNENDWARRTGVAAYTEDLPLIAVMPNAGDSWYVDSPGQGAYESFFTRELLPAIDRSFRTLPRREGRAVAGNSMGGYGAWRLALDHNDLFCCASSLSGALDMGVSDPMVGEPHDWILGLYGDTSKKAVDAYHADALYPRIDALTRRRGWRGPALRFDAGWDDYLLDGDRHMARYLSERSLPFEYAEYPGVHSWRYWDGHLRDTLNFVLRHVAAPTPH